MLTLRGPDCPRRGAALDDLSVISDGSILVCDGKIHAVGTTRRIENLKEARNAAEVDASGAIIMPAFVDGSLHFSPNISPATRKRKRISELVALMRQCMQHGTLNARLRVSVDDSDWRSRVSLVRQIAKAGDQLLRTTRTWQISELPEGDAQSWEQLSTDLSLLTSRKLIDAVEVAAERGLPVGDEISSVLSGFKEIGLSLLWRGGSAQMLAGLLQELQPMSVTCSGKLTEAECAELSAAGIPVSLAIGNCITDDACDSTPLELARAGAAIALASGYHPREMPVFNMQMIVALAVLRLQLSPEQAICAATINAAYALGVGHLIGSLEAGKRADLLVMNLPDYRDLPRRFGVNHVRAAIREGEVLFNRIGRKASAA